MARTSKTAKKAATVKRGQDQLTSEDSLHKPLISVKRRNRFRAAALRDLAESVKSDENGLTLDCDDVVLVNLSADS